MRVGQKKGEGLYFEADTEADFEFLFGEEGSDIWNTRTSNKTTVACVGFDEEGNPIYQAGEKA